MHIQAKGVKIILLVCVATIAFVEGIAIWHMFGFRVVNTEPSTSKVSTVAPFFKINFSQKLSSSNLRVTSSPSGVIAAATTNGNVLTVPFKTTPLTSGRTYTITIVSIYSANGKKITNKTFVFKPSYIASSELPKDQQEALLKSQGGGGRASSDPITKYLPYETTDFSLSTLIDSTGNQPKKFQLLAIITPSEADMGDEATAVSGYEQEVVSYITSLGLSPESYNITYKIQSP